MRGLSKSWHFGGGYPPLKQSFLLLRSSAWRQQLTKPVGNRRTFALKVKPCLVGYITRCQMHKQLLNFIQQQLDKMKSTVYKSRD